MHLKPFTPATGGLSENDWLNLDARCDLIMTSPKTLEQAIQYFRDEQRCIAMIARLRWPDGPRCPRCPGSAESDCCYSRSKKTWKCGQCGRRFSVRPGTLFENSAIPLQ